jgi:cell wall-associated NlpC family hydrolase
MLSTGSRGSDVTRLQQRLQAAGFSPGKVDGVFGKQTRAAVLAFQRAKGLGRDGVVGPNTSQRLFGSRDSKYFDGKSDFTPAPVPGTSPGSGSVSARTQRFIGSAVAQTGKPYVFGAEGPNAFDCSGLINYALRQAGVADSRTTAAGYQARFAGSRVSRSELKPGDLLFIHYPNNRGIPPGKASHIEIYLGNGRSMGTDNPREGARAEPVDWTRVVNMSRVPALSR